MTPESIRNFEKAPKAIIKMKGNEILFEDDASGKMQYIFAAFQDESALLAATKEVFTSEDGGKHLVRALNNFKSIPHMPAMTFARVIYLTVLPEFDTLTRVQKCQQLLDAIADSFEGDMAWLDTEVVTLLDVLKGDASARVMLWSAWLGANLRSAADAHKIIDTQAAYRPKNLTKPLFNQLVRTMNDAEERWEYRTAAMYALVGAGALPISEAHRFIDAAYTAFPLEALAGIEALALALELDAAALAEQEAIAEKLAQVRHDHLILREMDKSSFYDAASQLLQNQQNIPLSPLEVAVQLQALEKNERMMATILIDDARQNDFIQMAAKFQLLSPLAKIFFANFDPSNPLCRTLSLAFIHALAEINNLDALTAASWDNACERNDTTALSSLAAQLA